MRSFGYNFSYEAGRIQVCCQTEALRKRGDFIIMGSEQETTVKALLKSLAERPIAYQRIYALIAGSVKAGLLLSQILYWWHTIGEKEFYKTDASWMEELAIGLSGLKGVKSTLKSIGLISYWRAGQQRANSSNGMIRNNGMRRRPVRQSSSRA